ncbi:MAG: YegS/Rv2252/BmrU family lipid kinase [Ktedonobacteraceae bacterium]|nr:YegS/Rv2252/BmrU family lipid kinase [Ktedonobacteraceae bacterium]
MSGKTASLIINPRTGENVARLQGVLAVLSAAGWKTKIELKEYGKHGMQLAHKAAQNESDVVIAYGGDGTLNQIVNGVMSVKGHKSAVGILPGGTVNVWAGEIGVPLDPVKAALTLVSSRMHKVDVGRIGVYALTFPGEEPILVANRAKKKMLKESSKVRHHFLLMAGLGIDAAIMGGVSKPLKYRIGSLAVGLSAAREIPEQRSFPIEVESVDGDVPTKVLWKGEAMQVVVGNTRRYAGVVEITPDASIDDGVLDLRVITMGDPLTTMQQLSSLLLRQKLDTTTAEYFRAPHLRLTVPAHVPFQVDGSPVSLKDYLSSADYTRLQTLADPSKVTITYQLDALPKALDVAIPYTYNGELFEHALKHTYAGEEFRLPDGKVLRAGLFSQKSGEPAETTLQQYTTAVETTPESQLADDGIQKAQATKPEEEVSKELPDFVDRLLQNGQRVTVFGKVPDPNREQTFIIAGSVHNPITDERKPVAIVVNAHTTVLNRDGQSITDVAKTVGELGEGKLVVVEGKSSKRGAISAERIVL